MSHTKTMIYSLEITLPLREPRLDIKQIDICIQMYIFRSRRHV